MRIFKIVGQLALISFAIAFAFGALGISGYGLDTGRALGETIGAGLAMLAFSVIGAGIAAVIARRSRNGPLATGIIFIIVIVLANISAHQFEKDLPVDAALKDSIRSGFFSTCIAKLEQQSKTSGVPLEGATINEYCLCVYNHTLESITNSEVAEFAKTKFYPKRIVDSLPEAQQTCARR
jgi:hypothetical protein